MSDDFLSRIAKLSDAFNGASIQFDYRPEQGKTTVNCNLWVREVGQFRLWGNSNDFTSGGQVLVSAKNPQEVLAKLEEKLLAPGAVFYDSLEYAQDPADMSGNWPPRHMWEVQQDGTPKIVRYDEARVRAWLKREPAAVPA